MTALLPQWERGTPEQRALAWLLTRAGIVAARGTGPARGDS